MKDLGVRLAISVSFLAAFVAVPKPALAQNDAVVKIYAERSGQNSQGTGFFSDDEGQVITAYHVVENARKITVVSPGSLGSVSDVRVEFIAPEYDLAVLRVQHVLNRTPALSLDQESIRFGDVELSGYPRGGALAEFRGRTTSASFVDSQTIRDKRLNRLFRAKIDVIQLDLSVYAGLSGGPVIGPRGVVGVLSGSYDEGGGIGWAIPSKYLRSLTKIDARPEEMNWPPLTLMTTAWRNLRASVVLNSEASQIFERFMEESANMAEILDGVLKSAYDTQLAFRALRPFYQRLANDRTLRNSPDDARSLIGPLEDKAFGSFEEFLSFSRRFADDGQRLGVALADTVTWLGDEANVGRQQAQSLAREIRQIRNDIAPMTRGLDAYLGIDTTTYLNSVVAFNREMQLARGDFIAQSNARSRLVEAWMPAMARYSSADANLFSSRVVTALRRLGRLFEPFVYQRR